MIRARELPSPKTVLGCTLPEINPLHFEAAAFSFGIVSRAGKNGVAVGKSPGDTSLELYHK